MPRQALIVILAVVLWALSPEPALWAAAAAYLLSWALVNALLVWKRDALDFQVNRVVLVVLVAAMLALPARTLWARYGDLVEVETLTGVFSRSAERYHLERTPAVFPRIVFSDHPQLFYVHAPGAESASLRLGPDAEAVDGTALGHGLFRMRYDPRSHGEASATDGPMHASITVDGATTEREVRHVRPLPHPRWLRASPNRMLAATTSEESDEVIVVNREGLVRRVAVDDGPADCAFLDDHRIAVSHRFGPDVLVIDVETGETLRRVPVLPHQGHLAASPDGSALAVVVAGEEPGVFVVDAAAGSVREFVAGDADWLAFGANAETLIVSSRGAATLEKWAFEGGRRRVTRIDLGRPALSLSVDSEGDRAIVVTTDYRGDGERHFGNHFVQDQLLTVDIESFAVVDQTRTALRTPRQGSAGDVDSCLSPLEVDVLAGGAARVAFAGSDEVAVIRGAGDPRRDVLSTADIPLSAPHGVATFADGSFAVTSPSDGRIGVFSASNELRTLVALAPDDRELLAEAPEALKRRMGERSFYEGTRAGIACQSCHPGGGTDRVMRNIGGRRLGPTLSARGLAGTAPFLRDGSYPRLRDLNHLAETLFRGYRRARPGRPETLEAYVEALPREPSRALFVGQDRDLDRERRGVAAFVRAGCPTCHSFPAFTNLSQSPLGALFPRRSEVLGADASLDVPSLLTVGRGGPFLMDGRAESLEAVLQEENRDNRHGNTRALDDTELSDLVFFLEAL